MHVLQLVLTAEDGLAVHLAEALRGIGAAADVAILRSSGPATRAPSYVHEEPTWGTLRRLIDAADVVHAHGAAVLELLRPELDRKPVVVHLRTDVGEPSRSGLDVPHVVSAPRLLGDFPKAALIPDAVNTTGRDAPAGLGGGPVRIVRITCRRDPEADAFFPAVVERMREALHGRVEYVTASPELSRAERRALTAGCHISISDNDWTLAHSEALAEGLVVVSRLEPAHRAELERALGRSLPFSSANSLGEAGHLLLTFVREALTEPERFERRRAAGRAFASECLEASALLPRWVEVYGRTVGRSSERVERARCHDLIDG